MARILVSKGSGHFRSVCPMVRIARSSSSRSTSYTVFAFSYFPCEKRKPESYRLADSQSVSESDISSSYAGNAMPRLPHLAASFVMLWVKTGASPAISILACSSFSTACWIMIGGSGLSRFVWKERLHDAADLVIPRGKPGKVKPHTTEVACFP